MFWNTNLFFFTTRKPSHKYNEVFTAIKIDINVIQPLWKRNLEITANLDQQNPHRVGAQILFIT